MNEKIAYVEKFGYMSVTRVRVSDEKDNTIKEWEEISDVDLGTYAKENNLILEWD